MRRFDAPSDPEGATRSSKSVRSNHSHRKFERATVRTVRTIRLPARVLAADSAACYLAETP
jgi:hypothetical protein